MPSSSLDKPARWFSLAWGFSDEPLDILDDQTLLENMARLKDRSHRVGGQPTVTATTIPMAPMRPQTAPHSRSGFSQSAGQMPLHAAAMERREKWVKEQEKKHRFESAKREERSKEADAKVDERRRITAEAASSRVAAWDSKKRSANTRVATSTSKFLDQMRTDFERKEERL